jgi:hypothetical protein
MKILIPLILLLLPALAQAMNVSPLVMTGLEFGGDKLVSAHYSDGSTSDIQAGRGIVLAGGAVIDLTETAPHAFEAEATLGVKWTSTKAATNGEADWWRWPIEILSFYHNTEKHFRAGAGISYQIGNSLKGSKDASSLTTRFQNAAGIVFQGDYFVGEKNNVGLGLRYTLIQYSQAGSSNSVNGNSLGLEMTYCWL